MLDDTPSTPTALGNRQGRPQSEHSGVSGPAILHPDPRTILAPATAIVLDDNTSEESRESDEILESSVTGSSNRTSMTTETQATSLDHISTKTESDSVDSDNFSIAESLKGYFPDTDIAQTTDDESAMESRCADCEEVGITQCGISVAYFFLTLFQIVELQRQSLVLRRAGALPLQACLERRGLRSCTLPTHRELPFIYNWGVLRTPLFYQIKSLCNCTSATPKPLVPQPKRSTVISPALSNWVKCKTN